MDLLNNLAMSSVLSHNLELIPKEYQRQELAGFYISAVKD